MVPLIKNLRGTNLLLAFFLNALATALISTFIVEIRLSQSGKDPLKIETNKMLTTFVIGLISTFLVYNSMYLLVGYGSSLSATKYLVPYW